MMITILHLSDIHLSQSKHRDFQFVKDALLRDLLVQKETRKPDIICFSGDLVHAGGISDDFYVAYEQFIEQVLDVSEVSPERFFIVPGNHDIDREEVRNNPIIEDGQYNTLSSRERVNLFVDQILNGADTAFNFRRLENFFEFDGLIRNTPPLRRSPFFTTHKLQIQGSLLGIACLNTAWRSSGEEGRDYGRLLLGERAVTEASRDLADCDVRLAMFHHPLNWLREFDREDCRPLLLREFDLMLCGHTHRQGPEWQETPMGRAAISEGGALYVSRRWFNGYCLIQLDKQQQRCEFTVRRYEDEPKNFGPASNVAKDGRFLVRLRGAEDLQSYVSIENILQQLRPFWEDKAQEHILASYAGQSTGRRIGLHPVLLTRS
jgi:predicted MPP superfamily phosphohydrolase